MAYKEKEIVKKYYSISEVAKMFKVATSLIRFWETEFEVIKPRKNSKGNRQFTQEDIDCIKQVFHLVKEKGYTLQGAKEMLKVDHVAIAPVIVSHKSTEKSEAIKALEHIKGFLVAIQDQL
jgi:DNA-binding transcriptional MerR regulator